MLSKDKDLIRIMGILHRELYPQYMCSILSWILVYIAKILGYKSRCVGLTHPYRIPTEGHSVCEIMIDGKWICFDPAYNTCFYKSASQFGNDCIKFYPPEVRELKAKEFLELFSNRIYYDDLNSNGYREINEKYLAKRCNNEE